MGYENVPSPDSSHLLPAIGPSWDLSFPGAPVGRSWAILSVPEALLGRSWGLLGASWRRLGTVLGSRTTIFGPHGATLEL